MILYLLLILALGFFGWISWLIAGKICYPLSKNNYKNTTAIRVLTSLVIFVLLVFIALWVLVANVGLHC